MLLGTAAHMAPEQAAGKAADKRSDMWAFGCVRNEMPRRPARVSMARTRQRFSRSNQARMSHGRIAGDYAAGAFNRIYATRRCLTKLTAGNRISDATAARLDIDEADAEP